MKRVFRIHEKSWRNGTGIRFQWQPKKAGYLAATGTADNCFNIYDRYGEKLESISLPGTCASFSWNSEGELLALITDSAFTLFIWDAASKKVIRLDTGFRDQLSHVCWAQSGQLLAVTSCKGNVLIYDPSVHRKLPLNNKHSRKILFGCWSKQNLLALLSEDGTITVSNKDGETIMQTGVRGEAVMMQFNFVRLDSDNTTGQAVSGENCLSLVLNRKVLFLINIHDSEVPVSIGFPAGSGTIVSYVWLRDGLILVGFTNGTFSLISSHGNDFGKEVASFRAHKDSLTCFAYCFNSKKLASCSGNTIRIFDLSTDFEAVMAEEVLTVDDETRLDALQWTADGQMLTVTSSRATVYAFLSRLPLVGSSFGNRIAFLSSLTEVSAHAVDVNGSDSGEEGRLTIRLETEPSVIAVGAAHVAAVMNNKGWFYSLTGLNKGFLLKTIEYVGIIKDLRMNSDYAAALFTDGRIKLHLIDAQHPDNDPEREMSDSGGNKRESAMIDNKERSSFIRITPELLVFASEQGTIEFFYLEDWAVVNLYRHSGGIKAIETDLMGLRVAAIDELNKIFVYNAVTDVVVDLLVDEMPASPTTILWDKSAVNSNLFIAHDSKSIYVHSFIKETIEGSKIESVDCCKVPASQSPLLLYNGNVICQTTSGNKADFCLPTYDQVLSSTDRSALKSKVLPSLIKLRQYGDAIKVCDRLNDLESWKEVARTAIYDMNLDIAILVCDRIPDFGMSRSLKRLRNEIEERTLLMAHLAVCLDMYDVAQELFLASSRPEEALTMRQNIQDWETALILAKRLSPHLIPAISREYASQLELAAEYEGALIHFEKAMINSSGKTADEAEDGGSIRGDPQEAKDADKNARKHEEECIAGIARNAIRTGNTQRGLKCALKLKSNRDVQLECAKICESMKLFSDAANLYESAHEYEKAALLYIQVKNVAKVSQFIDHVSQTEPLIEYAGMQEQAHRFKEAIIAYRKAGQEEDVIRILLQEMKNPAEAMRIVRESKSVQGAKMIAKFFQEINDMSSAIEFLVLSQCTEEAFQLASSTGQMDAYASVLLSVHQDMKAPPISDFHSIALFYEQDRNLLHAGKFYCLSQDYRKGVKLLLSTVTQSPALESEAFQLAIEAAAKSQDEAVVRRVVDFLVGDVDGSPRDFKYLFRLYMKLGHYKEAAKTAIAIAREEQSSGNYRNAHSLLLGMSRELKKHDIRIPAEMNSSLLLIHSYLLAKAWIKIGDHRRAADLLIRVAKNVSRFPAHTVPILTSVVIECTRASFRSKAIEYATVLMKPEHRDLIDPKLRKKIENLVRKSAGVRRPSGGTEGEEDASTSPCPFCHEDVSVTNLSCMVCQNEIPFCIATGHHITRDSVTFCPHCEFPAFMEPLGRLLAADSTCPMCSAELQPDKMINASSEEVEDYLSNSKQRD